MNSGNGPQAIVVGEERYRSMEEARQHLRDLIHKNRSMVSEMRNREFQIIQEEIGEREHQ